MTPKELDSLARQEMKNYDFNSVKHQYNESLTIEDEDILSKGKYQGKTTLYHQWVEGLIQAIKPKMVVELGTHIGLCTGHILHALPADSKLVTVDCREDLAGIRLNPDSRMIQVIGDDINLSIFPKDIDLKKVELWFIDSDHSEKHIKKIYKIYKKFWKPNTIVLLDDIDEKGDSEFGVHKLWKKITYNKLSLPDLHYTGFGLFIT